MTLPRALLVTGTDTDVGKTVATAAIAASLSRHREVAVLKPAQTGLLPEKAGDVDTIRRLSGIRSAREGVRLRDPLAPAVAARREGRTLPSAAAHAATVGRLASTHDVVLVEGSGGFLVGLDDEGAGLSEIADHLTLPYAFVVVVRASLGTLNHTALTAEALRRRGHPILGLVVGSLPPEPGLAERTNLASLEPLNDIPVIGAVPAGAGSLPPAQFRTAAPTWLDLPAH